MRIEITKGQTEDRIVIARTNGTRAETRFPKKGPVPHDAVHWFVELELSLSKGFWGMVAAGMHPEEIQDMAKAAGHASAKRAGTPGAEIVELLQAERLVECFEADLWSPGGAPADLVALGEAACGFSQVHAPPGLDEVAVLRIRSALGAFTQDWIAAPQGYVAELEWR